MNRKIVICGLALVLVLLPLCQQSVESTWVEVINQHLQQYPQMKSQDIYKIIFQGVMGPFHLGKKRKGIHAYLQREWAQIEADPNQALVERIAPNGKYIRINLTRYKANKGDLEKMTEMVFQSCKETSLEKLNQALKQVTTAIKTNQIKYSPKAWLTYLKNQTKSNPTPHHSAIYKTIHKPSYRVISNDIWSQLR